MKNINKWIADYIQGILMLDEECQIDVLIDDVYKSGCDLCPLQFTCENDDGAGCGDDLREWAKKEYNEEELAQWIPIKNDLTHMEEIKCSNCGYERIIGLVDKAPKFCQNCGKRMNFERGVGTRL